MTARNIHDQRLLVVDFGSQYTQLIARRVREAGVYCEIHPFDIDAGFLDAFAPKGIILSGGPETVTQGSTPRIPDAVLSSSVPVLGICYGMQAMAAQLGGSVEGSSFREFGHASVRVEASEASPGLLTGLANLSSGSFDAWMSHGDKVTSLPPGFVRLASTDSAPIAAMAHLERNLFGIQFHPEVTHTENGAEIVRRFAVDICGCAALWTPDNIAEAAIDEVRNLVGDQKVVLGLSGGVDSSVVAALLQRAIGDNLTCVFVDNGLLRKNEREEVQAAFAPTAGNALNLNLITVDAADEFLKNLEGLEDPEDKRKAIGATFIDVFDRVAHEIKDVAWLAQ
ncbi:MAG: glutamine-hydrolyzing GMP synthase, partial [Gammaproteobacteria bacterium]|nr:glutamine-hydrolyzing GMP synthase [Gammaproteobacteria bacterium]